MEGLSQEETGKSTSTVPDPRPPVQRPQHRPRWAGASIRTSPKAPASPGFERALRPTPRLAPCFQAPCFGPDRKAPWAFRSWTGNSQSDRACFLSRLPLELLQALEGSPGKCQPQKRGKIPERRSAGLYLLRSPPLCRRLYPYLDWSHHLMEDCLSQTMAARPHLQKAARPERPPALERLHLRKGDQWPLRL